MDPFLVSDRKGSPACVKKHRILTMKQSRDGPIGERKRDFAWIVARECKSIDG